MIATEYKAIYGELEAACAWLFSGDESSIWDYVDMQVMPAESRYRYERHVNSQSLRYAIRIGGKVIAIGQASPHPSLGVSRPPEYPDKMYANMLEKIMINHPQARIYEL